MNYKKFLGAAGAALMIVTVLLLLASGAWAAGKYKTLQKFEYRGGRGYGLVYGFTKRYPLETFCDTLGLWRGSLSGRGWF
jgi:hypothetical protein